MRSAWKFILAWCALLPASLASAQDLAITNAHILDGNGGVIAKGTLVIKGGRIASLGSGPAPAGIKRVIDAHGRTVMPAFIDAHRHIGTATSAKAMQAWLDAGFTTVMDALGDVDALGALRKRIDSGAIAGPHLKISGFVPVNNVAMPQGVSDAGRADPARVPFAKRPLLTPVPPEQARAAVRALAAKGADNAKVVLVASPDGSDVPTLKAIADEAHKHHMRLIVHATAVEDELVAVAGGADLLVHMPHIGWVDEGDAIPRIVAAHIPMTSTLGVFTPYFGPEGDGVMRDFQTFPWAALHSAGQGPVNARLLWNAGVKIGYGTDTVFSPRESLRHELLALGSVFSAADIVTMLTANAAIAADVAGETGTLEPGKAADVVMLGADPLVDIFATLDPLLVLKSGVVVHETK